MDAIRAGHRIPYGTFDCSPDGRAAYRAFYRATSDDDSDQTPPWGMSALLPVDTVERAVLAREALAIAQRVLSERAAMVLLYRFVYDMTLDEVSFIFEVTRERIRQIESKALRLLRDHITNPWSEDRQ